MATLSQFSGGDRIKSIQRGIINLSGSVGTATLAQAVDTTKSILHHLGATNGISIVGDLPFTTLVGATTNQIRLVLTNSTTITASADISVPPGYQTGPFGGSVSWQLVEYY